MKYILYTLKIDQLGHATSKIAYNYQYGPKGKTNVHVCDLYYLLILGGGFSTDFGYCRLTRKRMGLLVRFLFVNVFTLSQRRGTVSLTLVVKLYPPVERHYTLFGWVSEKT